MSLGNSKTIIGLLLIRDSYIPWITEHISNPFHRKKWGDCDLKETSNSPLLFKNSLWSVSLCWTSSLAVPKPKHQHDQCRCLQKHAAHPQIHSHVQITSATLHCAHGGTLNTAAWGQKAMRNDACRSQHTYQITVNTQNIFGVGSGMLVPLRQHPVLHGFSVAAVTGVHRWDLLPVL